ncbi:hypothetical protein C1645_842059 [Glomus cerebriforme]|uniref:DUF7431 domain-containing protein n=1 Tax=Glomus cerebriforme TaxID=658196 RepID=A0A397S863_9GLOM|nr:hypothetical protein C1645_842059 [Glomus cerebriforme]
MENYKEILEQFKRRALEAGKIVKDLKASRYQYNYFSNQDNVILLKNLDENIKNIEMFVKEIGQFKEINQSRVSRISNIKKLYDARRIRESFDDNLDKVQKSMGNSKEQTSHNNEDLTDNELPIIPTTPTIEINETDISNTGISSAHDDKNGEVSTKTTSNTAITVAAETTTTLPTSPKTGGETTSIAIETEIDSEQEETSIGNESNEIVNGDKIILQGGKMVKTGGSETSIKNQIKISELDDKSNITTAGENGKTELPSDKNEEIFSNGSTILKDGKMIKSKTFNSIDIDENKNTTVTTTKITIGEDGETETMVTTTTEDSDGKIIYDATFVSEPEEIPSANNKEIVDDKTTTITNRSKLVKTSGSGTPIKRSKTFSNREIDENGDTTITTTTIATDNNGKTSTMVTIMKDTSGERIYDEPFVSEPEELPYISNKGKEILDDVSTTIAKSSKLVKTGDSGTPIKRSKTFSNIEIDENGDSTITTTEIATDDNGKTATTVKTMTKDSNGKIISDETFVSELEEIPEEILEDDGSITILSGNMVKATTTLPTPQKTEGETRIVVEVKIDSKQESSKFAIVLLTLENKLSDIREILKSDSIIRMDNTLLFSKKFPTLNIKNGFAEISRESEKDFKLTEIIEKIENDVEPLYTLYLIKSSRPYWKFLNDLHKLDFGCTMTSEGIERANKRAFKTENCQLTEINTEKDITVEFNSKEGWMMKKNLFYIPDMNVQYFAELGKKYENNELESFENKYRVIEKASFKICNLKATENFIEKVNEAIKLKDPKKFKQITDEFGQFIPTEVIMGHRIKIGDTADQTKKSDDYRKWDIIEFRNPISIFELIDDSLDNKLRKDVYLFFGKIILHTEIQGIVRNSEVETEIVDIPQTISEIISNKQAECSIFATVVGMKDYYHCQILTLPSSEPKLMIHCFKETSKDRELVIGWMVIGYDTNFKSIFSDCNTRLDDDTRFEILKKDYNPLEKKNSEEFVLNSPIERPYYIGIPVIHNSNLVIGHYFSNNREKLYTFAYSLKKKQQVELPKFSFNILEITNYNNSLMMFEKNMNNSIIDLDKHDEFKKFKNIPKFVSLYSNKNKNGQILLKQMFTKIKVKSLDKKLSNDDVLKCSFFIPFERYFLSFLIILSLFFP